MEFKKIKNYYAKYKKHLDLFNEATTHPKNYSKTHKMLKLSRTFKALRM